MRTHSAMLVLLYRGRHFNAALVIGQGRRISGSRLTRFCRLSEVKGRARRSSGQSFWARGHFASTVGRDEKVIREYIRKLEQEDKRIEQLKFRL